MEQQHYPESLLERASQMNWVVRRAFLESRGWTFFRPVDSVFTHCRSPHDGSTSNDTITCVAEELLRDPHM
jgi:hypothetical protein